MPLKDTNWPDRLDAGIRLFFYILAFWIPYSPAVLESCVVTAILLWIVKRIILCRGKKNIIEVFEPPPSILNRPIYFFLIICVFSILSSVLWTHALADFITKILEWFAIVWLIQESFKDKKQVFLLIRIFLVSATTVALDGLMQYYVWGKDIFNGNPISPDGRATASFNAPPGLGGFMSAAIPLSAGVFLLVKRTQRPLCAAVIGAMVWTLMLTFVRGAWVGAFTGILVFSLVYFLLKGNFEIVKTLGTGVIFILLTVLFPLVLNMDATLKLLNRSNTVSWRLNVWEDTLPMIKDRPLFGHGINTYMPVFQAYRRDPGNHPTYAHNGYIQIASEIGLLGLAGFLWIFFRFFVNSWRQLRIMDKQHRDIRCISTGMLAGVAGFMTHSFFDTNFYSLQLSVLLWFLVGTQIKIIQLR